MTTNPTPTPAGAQEAVSGLLGRRFPIEQEFAVVVTAMNAGRIDGAQAIASLTAIHERFVRETAERAWNEGVEAHATSVGPPTVTEMRTRNPYAAKEADR